jgi:integrase
MAIKLTAKSVENWKPGPDRQEIPDTSGVMLVVQPSGAKSWASRPRWQGKPIKITHGLWPAIQLAEARKKHAEAVEKIARGIDPREEQRSSNAAAGLAQRDSLRSVSEQYLTLMEKRGQQRAIHVVRANLERLVFPTELGGMPVSAIRKSEFVRLFDRVERERGARMADVIRGNLSTVLKWYAERSDTFVNPLAGMQRRDHAGPRQRVLDDEEIRRVWAACDQMTSSFGQAVKMLLLTACRRNEVAHMTWGEVNNGGLDWTIPAARYKGAKGSHDHLIPLSAAARTILNGMPHEGELVFPNRGGGKIIGFASLKIELDRLSGVTGWTLHDLRRTARSLMSRAGVNADHAERCLGHVIGGVRGIYDRHAFYAEKQHAFEALAGLLDRIVHPPGDVVVPLRG